MASPQASEHILSTHKITLYHYDIDDAANDVAWVDMQNYRHFAVGVLRTIGTGDIDGFQILANAQSNGGGTDVVIKTASATLIDTADAPGDYVWLECTAEEIAQEAADAGITGVRYVSASLDLQTTTDECAVVYILAHPRFASTGLTTDYIS